MNQIIEMSEDDEDARQEYEHWLDKAEQEKYQAWLDMVTKHEGEN